MVSLDFELKNIIIRSFVEWEVFQFWLFSLHYFFYTPFLSFFNFNIFWSNFYSVRDFGLNSLANARLYYFFCTLSRFQQGYFVLSKNDKNLFFKSFNFYNYYVYAYKYSAGNIFEFYKRFWQRNFLTIGLVNLGLGRYTLRHLYAYTYGQESRVNEAMYFFKQTFLPAYSLLKTLPTTMWSLNAQKPLFKVFKTMRKFFWTFYLTKPIRKRRYLSFLKTLKYSGLNSHLITGVYLQIFKGLDFISSLHHLEFLKKKKMIYYNKKPLKCFTQLEEGVCLSLGYGFCFAKYKVLVKKLEKKYYKYIQKWTWLNRMYLASKAFFKNKFFFSIYMQRVVFKENFLQQAIYFDVILNLIIILNLKIVLKQQLVFYFLANQQLRISAWRY